MTVRVLVTCRQMQGCIDEFRARFAERSIELTLPAVTQQLSEAELIGMIGGYDGIIAGDDPLSAEVLEHAGRLRVISKWGVGVDGIDRDAALQRGIVVTNTPGAFGDEVADVAVAYVVMLARQLHRIHASVLAGGWWKYRGRTLRGATLGVAGFGSIGRAVADRAAGFGLKSIVYDVSSPALSAARRAGLSTVSRDELFLRSEFLVLCCPLTHETRELVNARTLDLMPWGGCLVNVARGGLVNEGALVAALSSGRLGGAALDVFEEEPLSLDHPLRSFEQCVFGSHNGSNTREGVLRASAVAVSNLLEALEPMDGSARRA